MGCRFSKEQVSEHVPVRPATRIQPHRDDSIVNNSGSSQVVISAAEKRARAAEAAEARKKDWRQGGHADPKKARNIAKRREKDETLARIYHRYTTLDTEPPIGLPSCDLEQLRRHFETLR